MIHMNIFPDDRIFEIIARWRSREQVEAYVIGGYVRDHIMGRDHPDKDIDIVVLGDGARMARAVAKEINPILKSRFSKHSVPRCSGTGNYDIEFVGARKESYSSNSRKPAVLPGTLEDDQNRRDFTINALAISLNRKNFGEVIDPFGGLDDIRNKILRTPLDPDATFSDDPLRMMRAIRFASQLGFRVSDDTLESVSTQCRKNQDRLSGEDNG